MHLQLPLLLQSSTPAPTAVLQGGAADGNDPVAVLHVAVAGGRVLLLGDVRALQLRAVSGDENASS